MQTVSSNLASACAAFQTRAKRHQDDRGLGLVEIVVAMFLLALLSVAFLPLLINSLQQTIRNATISTATQVLNEQLDALLAAQPTCAAITAFESAVPGPTTDRRGVVYQATRSVPECSSLTYAGLVHRTECIFSPAAFCAICIVGQY